MNPPPPVPAYVPMSESLACRLLDGIARDHPRPWTIDQDWLSTVVDARGAVVMSAPLDVAQELVFLVEQHDHAMAEARAWLDRELGKPGEDP